MWNAAIQLEYLYRSSKKQKLIEYSPDKIIRTKIVRDTRKGKDKIQPVYIEYNYHSFLNKEDRHHILNTQEMNEIKVGENFNLELPKRFILKGFFSIQDKDYLKNVTRSHDLKGILTHGLDHYNISLQNVDKFLKKTDGSLFNLNPNDPPSIKIQTILRSGRPFIILLDDQRYLVIHTTGYLDGIFMYKSVGSDNITQTYNIKSVTDENKNDVSELGIIHLQEYCKRGEKSVIMKEFQIELQKQISEKKITHYIHEKSQETAGCVYFTLSKKGDEKINKPYIYIHLLCVAEHKTEKKQNDVKGYKLLNSVLKFAQTQRIDKVYISSILNPIETFVWWIDQGFKIVVD
tara:strand:- start:1269 stop:2309 length:1041 start_codon:yes stop_codon:yes gene_type:complete